MRWDRAATWEACVRRLEELQSVPADQRSEAEERARYALLIWLSEHAAPFGPDVLVSRNPRESLRAWCSIHERYETREQHART